MSAFLRRTGLLTVRSLVDDGERCGSRDAKDHATQSDERWSNVSGHDAERRR
jgi:hypothetical protein